MPNPDGSPTPAEIAEKFNMQPTGGAPRSQSQIALDEANAALRYEQTALAQAKAAGSIPTTAYQQSQLSFQEQQLQFQRQNAAEQNDLQRQSLNLQAQVRNGELTLEAAKTKLDRAYKEQVLRQNERVARANALNQANQLELSAAGYRLPKGSQYFPGFEPSGLAAQLAKQYGFSFTAPNVVPVPFDPRADVISTFPQGGDQNITLPDVTGGLSFNFTGLGGYNPGGGYPPGGYPPGGYTPARVGAGYQLGGGAPGTGATIPEDYQGIAPGRGRMILEDVSNVPLPVSNEQPLSYSFEQQEQNTIAERERQRQIAAGYGVELR